MADDDTGTDEEPPEGDDDTGEDKTVAEQLRKKNSENRNLRERLRKAEEAERKLKEIEDAGKSELDRVTAERDDLAARVSQMERDMLRLEVALDKGLTRKQMNRLHGDTIEDLEADADELLEELGSVASTAPPVTGRPKERLRSGAVADAEPEEADPAKLAAMVSRDGF